MFSVTESKNNPQHNALNAMCKCVGSEEYFHTPEQFKFSIMRTTHRVSGLIFIFQMFKRLSLSTDVVLKQWTWSPPCWVLKNVFLKTSTPKVAISAINKSIIILTDDQSFLLTLLTIFLSMLLEILFLQPFQGQSLNLSPPICQRCSIQLSETFGHDSRTFTLVTSFHHPLSETKTDCLCLCYKASVLPRCDLKADWLITWILEVNIYQDGNIFEYPLWQLIFLKIKFVTIFYN